MWWNKENVEVDKMLIKVKSGKKLTFRQVYDPSDNVENSERLPPIPLNKRSLSINVGD